MASVTEQQANSGGLLYRLWLVYFFQGMAPGFWVPALTNILSAQGLSDWVALAFMIGPLGALVSPLLGGALADQLVSANRLYTASTLLAAVALAGAFGCLALHWNPWWFFGILMIHAVLAGPGWGLLAMVALTHLRHGERQFPLVRLGSTMGWVMAGSLTSFVFKTDTSASTGGAAAVAAGLAGLAAMGLPSTPPLGRVGSWRNSLGMGAFGLLRERDQLVFFTVTLLFSIPLAGFYMLAPQQLLVLGGKHPTATMSIAQWSEMLAMLVVAGLMTRYHVKTLLLWALGISVLRYGMSAYAGACGLLAWHIAGIALHGICYTFYFVTAQVFLDRRVAPELKGQAQGLLTLAASGLGPLLGALLCGWLRGNLLHADGSGWLELWLTLGAMIAACFGILALFYRGSRG
ncbi:MAG: nucleoside permease [Verrucomicrobia bacterium]|nr:MAG: nucleoside permease [Verrucomicrobiota bacterium]